MRGNPVHLRQLVKGMVDGHKALGDFFRFRDIVGQVLLLKLENAHEFMDGFRRFELNHVPEISRI